MIFSWKDAQANRQEHIGITRDLSVSGAFVVTPTPPPLDASIKFKGILPPGGKVLPARIFGEGKVVRVEPAPGRLLAGFAVAEGRIVFRRWAEDW